MRLELGKIYEVRSPKDVLSDYKMAYVQLTKKTGNPLTPFLGNNGAQYSVLGLVDSIGRPSVYDLVKEIDTNRANPLNIDYKP